MPLFAAIVKGDFYFGGCYSLRNPQKVKQKNANQKEEFRSDSIKNKHLTLNDRIDIAEHLAKG